MMTNEEFARTDFHFGRMCFELGMPPTKRQASKWRMGKGRAFHDGPPAYAARIEREEREAEERRQWHEAIPGFLLLFGVEFVPAEVAA